MLELMFLAGLIGGLLGSSSRSSGGSGKSSSSESTSNQNNNLNTLYSSGLLNNPKNYSWTNHWEDPNTGDYWKHKLIIKIKD